MSKTALQAHLSCSVQKAAYKNTKYLQNDNFLKIGKIGHNPWAIAFAKSSIWVKTLNSKKRVKNDSTTHLSCSLQKTGFKKHQIFAK